MGIAVILIIDLIHRAAQVNPFAQFTCDHGFQGALIDSVRIDPVH